MKRITIYYFIFIILVTVSSTRLHAFVGEVTIEQAVEMSDKQRILAQKAAKIYIGLCNNLKDIKLYQERDATIEEFEENLYDLGKLTPVDPIREAHSELKESWKAYSAIVGWSIKKDDGAKLLKQLDYILQATKKLHRAYLDYQASQRKRKPTMTMVATDKIIQQNTNQKILIERILLYYLAEKSGIAGVESGHKLDEANAAFSTLLKELMEEDLINPAIQQKYNEVKETWTGIAQHLVFTAKKEQSHLDDMYLRADKISRAINDISSLYEELGEALSVGDWMLDMSNQSFCVQRMTRQFVALIAVDEPTQYVYKKDILDQVNLFEKQLKAFEQSAPRYITTEDLATIWSSWNMYKGTIANLNKIEEADIKETLSKCDMVVVACQKIMDKIHVTAEKLPSVQQLKESRGISLAPTESIVYQMEAVGELRIISQRVAKSFVLKVHNPNTHNDSLLQEDIASYEEKYQHLLDSKHNSIAKQRIIESCSEEWDWIMAAIVVAKESDVPTLLEHADLLGKKLSKLNKLYGHQMQRILLEKKIDDAPPALATQKE